MARNPLVFAGGDDARRAQSHRVTVANAADGAKVAEKIVSASEAALQGLPAGATVKVAVSSRNGAGSERKACEPVRIAVPQRPRCGQQKRTPTGMPGKRFRGCAPQI
ncbi:MAG: hypothetical protein HY674_17485 [Chloroflexi bacterium]|nr:hypothetical protein [Chloroflexota bacterium]